MSLSRLPETAAAWPAAVNVIAGTLVVVFALVLAVIATTVFVQPSVASRFFLGFASSLKTHLFEQTVRLVFGAALIQYSASMWQAPIFLLLGWALALSAAMLMILPWRWHQRFAERVLPVVVSYLRFYGVMLMAFAGLLLFGVLGGLPR